jgi:hypothetical protein
MPAMVDALSGKPLQQDITIDMSEAAKYGKQQSDELRKGLLQCFIADLDTSVKEPGSYDAGLKVLGSKAHRRHRDVIFGKKAIEIIANKLPDSCRMYLTRHNDELKKNAQAVRLAQARAK